MTATKTHGTDRLRRAGHALALATAVGGLFTVAPSTDALLFVAVTLPVVPVLLVMAVLDLLAARSGRPMLYAVAAVVGLLAAVVQLVQAGRDPNWLGGNGSTAAFLAAMGVGALGLWSAGRQEPADARTPPDGV